MISTSISISRCCSKIILNLMLSLAMFHVLRGLVTVRYIENKTIDEHENNGYEAPPLEEDTMTEKVRVYSPNKKLGNMAYTIAITKDSMETIDGAAVLAHSIRKNHNKEGSNDNNYDLLALMHPSAISASLKLEKVGYKIIVLETPVVDISQIKNQVYAKEMQRSGCCGEKEFMKLHTFRLFNYSKVVYFDTDALLLRSLTKWLAMDKSFVYGYDYTNVGPNHYEKACVQGGFFIAKPSQLVFDRILSLVLEGKYSKQTGWRNTKAGSCFGGETIQGIFSYYVQHMAQNTNDLYEADRCILNSFDGSKSATNGYDCQYIDVNQIFSFHFTNQKKPWKCNTLPIPPHGWNLRRITNTWWAYRNEMELERNWTVVPKNIGCRDGKYIPISILL